MQKIIDYIKDRFLYTPRIGVVLGSGLDAFSNELESKVHIKYNEIPNFRKTSIKGHKGEFVLGKLYNEYIVCANGRFHYYEGYEYNDVATIIDVFKTLGCECVIMTNASGCVIKEWNVGDLMLINGHLDYSFIQSSQNPSIIRDERYGPELLNKVKKLADDLNIILREGIYTWTTGPSYETPAEVRDIKALGGHCVGMSGLPEIERIHNLKMKMIGLCCLTNYASGMSGEELTHKEVVQTAQNSQKQLIRMLNAIINNFKKLNF